MKYILTGLRNKRTKNGTHTEIYLWHPHEPKKIIVKLPHVIPSRPLPIYGDEINQSIDIVLRALKEKARKGLLKGCRIKKTGGIKLTDSNDYESVDILDAGAYDTLFLSQDKRIIQIMGPPEMIEDIFDKQNVFESIGKTDRVDKRNNVTRIHELQTGFPFGEVIGEENGNINYMHSLPSIEELSGFPLDAFDGESQAWEKSLDFPELDVPTDPMKHWLHSTLIDSVRESSATIQLINSITGQRPTDLEEILKNETNKIEKENKILRMLENGEYNRYEILRNVLDYKLLRDKFEFFGISYVTNANLNIYFSIYPEKEHFSVEQTAFGNYTFHNIIVDDISKLDEPFAELCSAIELNLGSEAKEKLVKYFNEDRKRIRTPSEAIVFLLAITKRVFNAFVTGGHNIDTYDYQKMVSNRNTTFFKSGMNGDIPYTDGNMKFYVRTVEPGRFNMDTCLLSQKYLPGTTDNKLFTVLRQLFGLKESKEMTYVMTTKARLEAFFGNLESSRRVGKYCKKDSVYHFKAVEAVLKPVLLLSKLLSQAPEVVVSTSYKNLSEQLMQMKSLETRNCYMDNRFGDFIRNNPADIDVRNPNSGELYTLRNEYFDDFEVEVDKNKILLGVLKKISVGNTKTSMISDLELEERVEAVSPKFGNKKNVDIFYLTPFIAAFSSLIDKNQDAVEVLNEVNRLGSRIKKAAICSEKNSSKEDAIDSVDRVSDENIEARIAKNQQLILLQGLQRDYLAMPIHVVLNSSPTRGHAEISEQKYSPDKFIFEKMFDVKIHELNNAISRAKEKFQKALLKYHAKIINSKTLTAIQVPEKYRKEFSEYLEKERLGYHYTSGEVFSVAAGKFAFYADDTLMRQGIDLKFNRGLKNSFEEELMTKFLELYFEKRDHKASVELIANAATDLKYGRVPLKKLVYLQEESKKNPEQYSSLAQGNRQIMQKIINNVRKGQRFGWAYTSEGKVKIPEAFDKEYDREMYLKIMFGEWKDDKWTFSSYRRDGEFSKKGKLKESPTSCGSVLEAVLVYNTEDVRLIREKREALVRIVTGETRGDEINLLANNEMQQSLF